MKEIASWDMEKCFEVTQEMLPTLIHNFNVLMKGETLEKLIDELEDSEIQDETPNVSVTGHKSLI